jgi:predicted DNA-binding protein YlxM (UPF0122 family)
MAIYIVSACKDKLLDMDGIEILHVEQLHKMVRIGHLLELYGPLLTDHQQRFLRLHYNEDFSFGEIAGEYAISRQAVYDTVKNGEAQLEEYERKLGHLTCGDAAFTEIARWAEEANQALENNGIDKAHEAIERILERCSRRKVNLHV